MEEKAVKWKKYRANGSAVEVMFTMTVEEVKKIVEVAGRQSKLQLRGAQKGTHLYGKLRSLMKFKRAVTRRTFAPENKIKSVVLSIDVWRKQSKHAVTRQNGVFNNPGIMLKDLLASG